MLGWLLGGPKKGTWKTREIEKPHTIHVDIYKVENKKGKRFDVCVQQPHSSFKCGRDFDSRTGEVYYFDMYADSTIEYHQASIGSILSFEEFIKNKVTVQTTTGEHIFVSDLVSAVWDNEDTEEVWLTETEVYKE
jgi:hypothetical protein